VEHHGHYIQRHSSISCDRDLLHSHVHHGPITHQENIKQQEKHIAQHPAFSQGLQGTPSKYHDHDCDWCLCGLLVSILLLLFFAENMSRMLLRIIPIEAKPCQRYGKDPDFYIVFCESLNLLLEKS